MKDFITLFEPDIRELDIRGSFNRTIDGINYFDGVGRKFVLQSVIRDEGGRPKQSPYSDKYTKEVNLRQRYPNTTVTGYLCNEKIINAYMVPLRLSTLGAMDMKNVGVDNDAKYVLYIKESVDIRSNDIIVAIELNSDGTIKNPITPIEDYIVIEVADAVGDGGRTEFKHAIIKVIK